MTALKLKQINFTKQKVLYTLEDELVAKIEQFNMPDDKKALCLQLCLESAKEGMSLLGDVLCK